MMTTAPASGHTNLRHRLAALGTAGALALGGGMALSAGLDSTPASAQQAAQAAPHADAQKAGNGQLVAINQFTTGLSTTHVDCGPAAAASTMLAQGHKPAKWVDGKPGAAVGKIRADIGTNGPTNAAQVAGAIKAQGVKAQTQTGTNAALQAVRSGKSAIFNGNLGDVPYKYSYTPRGPVQHWIAVADYDASSKTYTVLDSNDGSKRVKISEAGLRHFQDTAKNRSQVVVG